MIIIDAIVEILTFKYATDVVMTFPDSKLWDWFAAGKVLGIPGNFILAIVIAIFLHIYLTRMRNGWHITAVGGSRRSAYNAGINVRGTVCLTYVMSGAFASFAGILYAARLNSAGSETGSGLEVMVLTAAVLGGNSLGGGRGSVAKALLGTLIVVILTNSLLRLQMPSGYNSLLLAGALLLAVATDIRWVKNRHKLLSRVYVSPTYFSPATPVETDPEAGTPYAINDRLTFAEPLALDQVDGAEDIAFDRDDNLYAGSRHGDVIRFKAPDYKEREIYAHIGGQPLGLHFDGEGALFACVSGMGLYKVTPDRAVHRLADETNRSLFSIIDDSRMRFADDMDFGPDGKVYFSEATIRYDVGDWATDSIEGRGNGRILCYDPKDRRDPHGAAQAHVPERHLHDRRWPVAALRRDLGRPRQPLLVRWPAEGQGRHHHRRHARLSRQHPPLVGRPVLGGAARHAHAGDGPRHDHARLPPPHDPACRLRGMDLSQPQFRRRHQDRHGRSACSSRCGTGSARNIR